MAVWRMTHDDFQHIMLPAGMRTIVALSIEVAPISSTKHPHAK